MLTINNTLDGYLKGVEILGNTIQDASNLADIRSVGDKVEGQELYEIPVLSRGKNLLSCNNLKNVVLNSESGVESVDLTRIATDFIRVEKGEYTLNNTTNFAYNIFFFDKNKNYVRRALNPTKFNVNANEKYIRWNGRKNDSTTFTFDEFKNSKLIMSQGTVATEYEPYVEDKLTILSPVQLEKVGDVADRIIEKDGVWGVEKNNIKVNAKDLTFVVYRDTNDVIIFNSTVSVKQKAHLNGVSNKLKYSSSTWNDIIVEDSIGLDNASLRIFVKFKKSTLSTIEDFNKFKEDLFLLYQREVCEFIPLPHDQQVKLRTFANKTNISFGCEIEGTIKAQVPKSLGATVNTHTEQINNLNKELDRVKKLEESTVSTVETESDFTTVEATSNGYFEDVKLEGKTLVNLSSLSKINQSNSPTGYSEYRCLETQSIKSNTTYTLIFNSDLSDNKVLVQTYSITNNMELQISTGCTKGINVFKIVSTENTKGVRFRLLEGVSYPINITNIMLLEGDHTQNPPSYFEGLKNVGDGADEIVVESVDDNINNRDNSFTEIIITDGAETTDKSKITTGFNPISVDDDEVYLYRNGERSTNDTTRRYYSKNKVYLGATYTDDAFYVRFRFYNGVGHYEGNINEYKVLNSTMKEGKSDKKRLLYYNEETQAWEKPILREWDSIEKHADGKYYYHQRSMEIILNGDTPWRKSSILFNDKARFIYDTKDDLKADVDNLNKKPISDKYTVNVIANVDELNTTTPLNYHTAGRQFYLDVVDMTLEDFNNVYIRNNPFTLVYKLAQEKVYECTNIDLITYNGETNYIVNSGAIVPKTTLKVHNNISNVVSLLQKKVSLLENNITSYMITQNRLQLASTYSADSVTFKVDYFAEKSVSSYDNDLFNLILSNILVGKENYDYNKMFNIIMDYASWSQISWDQFDILVEMMDLQHNPPIELPTEEFPEETPEE